MRLLNINTRELETFTGPGNDAPAYAILSHTWGAEEILFKDLKSKYRETSKSKHGYQKVEKSCIQAEKDGYTHIWIDTCCIDKSSSAELSEAINSMFEWYRCSGICYAYLADVSGDDEEQFNTSKWFTRGWTLQELIAPTQVEFFDRDWIPLGDRRKWALTISALTSIREPLLNHGQGFVDHDLGFFGRIRDIRVLLKAESVAAKMAWASNRQTTRPEDVSYCLMGLFEVNMPLLYGEGDRAYKRLQKEIMKITDDHSILCWGGLELNRCWETGRVLANSPFEFKKSPGMVHRGPRHRKKLFATPHGLEIFGNSVPCTHREVRQVRDVPVKERTAYLAILKAMKLGSDDSKDEESFKEVLQATGAAVGSWKRDKFCLMVLDCPVDGSLFRRPALVLESSDSATFATMSRLVVDDTTVNIVAHGGPGMLTIWPSPLAIQRLTWIPDNLAILRPQWDAVSRKSVLISHEVYSGRVSPIVQKPQPPILVHIDEGSASHYVTRYQPIIRNPYMTRGGRYPRVANIRLAAFLIQSDRDDFVVVYPLHDDRDTTKPACYVVERTDLLCPDMLDDWKTEQHFVDVVSRFIFDAESTLFSGYSDEFHACLINSNHRRGSRDGEGWTTIEITRREWMDAVETLVRVSYKVGTQLEDRALNG
jgi:hypothetical protein